MTRTQFTSLACALTAALALTACNRDGSGGSTGAGGGTTTTTPSTGGGMAGGSTSGAMGPASAASR